MLTGGGEMNEIPEKRIEEAAIEYAHSIPQSDESLKLKSSEYGI